MPAYSLGLGDRYKIPLTISPGPGNYFDKAKDDTGIPSKSHRKINSEKPSLSKTAKKAFTAFITPGPGTHEIPSCFHSKALSKDGKKAGDNKQLTKSSEKLPKCVVPGPGAYDSKMINTSRAPSFGYKFDGIKLNEPVRIIPTEAVGPGTYKVEGNLLKPLISSTPSKEDNVSNSFRASTVPGPGAYNPSFERVYNVSRKPTMGCRISENALVMNNPGPAAYQIETTLCKDCPRYGFGSTSQKPVERELKENDKRVLTSSDAYNKSKQKLLPGIKIMKDTNHSIKKEDDKKPGPGQYDVVKSIDEIANKQRYFS